MNLVKSFLGKKQFERDNYNICSLNHEINLQLVKQSTTSQFDNVI